MNTTRHIRKVKCSQPSPEPLSLVELGSFQPCWPGPSFGCAVRLQDGFQLQILDEYAFQNDQTLPKHLVPPGIADLRADGGSARELGPGLVAGRTDGGQQLTGTGLGSTVTESYGCVLFTGNV